MSELIKPLFEPGRLARRGGNVYPLKCPVIQALSVLAQSLNCQKASLLSSHFAHPISYACPGKPIRFEKGIM